MCWLAVEASHSNGLSHLQGRQAHNLTLCVSFSFFPASQIAAAAVMGGAREKKKKTREPHSNRLELKRKGIYCSTLSVSKILRFGCESKAQVVLIKYFNFFFFMQINLQKNKHSKIFYSAVLVEKNMLLSVVNGYKFVLRQSCYDSMVLNSSVPREMHHVSSCPQLIRSFYRLQRPRNN